MLFGMAIDLTAVVFNMKFVTPRGSWTVFVGVVTASTVDILCTQLHYIYIYIFA